jgi:AcrR family transcriptional regulator
LLDRLSSYATLDTVSSRKSEETKTAILDAARQLFELEGYHAVGLEAVARKAGVSRQAIYLHFDSKAALLEALHHRVNKQHVEPAMQRVWKCPDAISALDVFVAASATAIPRFIGIFNALEAAARVDPDAAATWQPPREGRYADCVRMAEWLERDGALANGMNIRSAADVLFTLASVPAYESLVMICGWSPRRWTSWTRQTLRTALIAPA